MSKYVSGNGGRLFIQGTSTPLAITKWSMRKTTKAVQLLHTESYVDGDGNIWEDQLPGTSNADIAIEGWVDVNASTAIDSGSPAMFNGANAICSLILDRTQPLGFNQVSIQIEQLEFAMAEIGSDKPSTFKLTAKVKGSPGKLAIVTG